MQLDKEESEYTKCTVDVNFDMYGNYYFYFRLDYIDWFGDYQMRAIKIDRETRNPIIVDDNQEAPYWIAFVRYDNSDVPEWAKDTIYYQIFVDRFYRSQKVETGKQLYRNYRQWGEMPNWKRNEFGEFHNNDFFCGNIKGVEEKLLYLKNLGVGVIYLSPINESMYRYERYASTNHMKIDPDAGDFDDLDSLHRKAHEFGMHIVLDIALNHCSSDNPIFQDALNNPKSPYRDWFYFDSNNNYKYWYGEFRDMPIFNQFNQNFQNYVYGRNGVIDTFSRYVDGFRLDVAEELNPFFIQGIRDRANANGKHLIIGECWHKLGPEMLGTALDTVTNYIFTNAVYKFVVEGDITGFIVQVMSILDSYPQNTIDTMLNSLDTHDIVRALTILGGKNMRHGADRIWDIDKDPSPWHRDTIYGRRFDTDGFRQFEMENDKLDEFSYIRAKKLLKVCSMILYFLPGCPCIFYGTEIGLHGYKDPFNRKTFSWEKQDKELLKFYQKLCRFRNSCSLKNGYFSIREISTNHMMFTITNEENSLLVAVNRTDKELYINVPREFRDSNKKFVYNATEKKLSDYGGIIISK